MLDKKEKNNRALHLFTINLVNCVKQKTKQQTFKMKKLLFPLIAMLLILASCGGEEDLSADLPGFLITGEIEGADDTEAVLIVFEDEKERVIDTVKIVDGKFEIQTDTKELRQYVLVFGQQEMPLILILDENSNNVAIKGSIPGIGDNYTITGSDESQFIKDYLVFLKPHFDAEQKIYAEVNTVPPTDTATIMSYVDKLDSISLIQRDYALAHIEGHPGSAASWLMLRELFPASGLENFDAADLKYFRQVADGMREKYPYSEYPDLIDRDIESVEAQIEQMNNPQLSAGSGTATFEYAPEISMLDRDGKELKLSSLRGKVVLIDFWASWCKPCRQENPNVVRVYEQYKDKGFTVFSVSLDEQKDAWLKAIEADNLSWPNHVSDLTGWQSSAAVSYGVNGIPATFLIDGEGKVIATDLRGPKLEQILQQVLG